MVKLIDITALTGILQSTSFGRPISSFGILGPYFCEGKVTGDNYLDTLENYVVPGLMMRVENFLEIYFQHDGAPPHYATAVRNYLNKAFNRRVIGRRADIDMPQCTPMDFFCMGHRQGLCLF